MNYLRQVIKNGENSAAERYLPQADVVISQPFWPFYLDAARFNKAKKLKLGLMGVY